MAENKSENYLPDFDHSGRRNGWQRLLVGKESTSAGLERRAGRAFMVLGQRAMMLPGLPAAWRQFLIACRNKRCRADQRKAEYNYQQSCPDATH